MARNGGAKKIAVNGVYLISVLRLKHFDLISDALPFGHLWHGARIVFDCRTANDPGMMSSTIPALILGLALSLRFET